MIKDLKAVIYARVSTEEQATEGYSITAQKDALTAHAKRLGFELIAQYIDEGKSGKSISGRPQMSLLLEDAAKKKFDVVIVFKLDRLARKTRDSLEIVETLEKHNIQLISLSESIDTTTPHGKMFYTVLSSIAEMERGQIVSRVKMGMNQRAKEGKWNGGVCFGYDTVNKSLVINEEEAIIVKEIFEYADMGYGFKKIVSILNKKGLLTKRKHPFSIGSLKGILENPVYKGKIRFNQHENWSEKRRAGKGKDVILVDGHHTPIIDADLWERVQEKLSIRSFKAVQSETPYILSSLLRCPQCGAGMVASKTKTPKKVYRYYICGKFHNQGTSVCSSNSINADRAEAYVFSEFKRLVTDSHFLQRLVTKLNQERENSHKPLLYEQRRLLKAIKQRTQYIENISTKLMGDPELAGIFAQKLKEQQREKAALSQELLAIEHELSFTSTRPIDLMALHYLVKNIDEIMKQADPLDKKELLRLLIREIEITPSAVSRKEGRQISRIHLHFDFTPMGVKKKSKTLLLKMAKYTADKHVDLSSLNKRNPTDKEIRDLLESLFILPSLMIRFTLHNPKTPINLLQQDQLHQLVRKRHLRKR